MSCEKALASAVKEFVAAAQAAFTVSSDKQEIKASTTVLSDLLRQWQANDKMITQAIVGLLRIVRQNCKHEGAQFGSNERDGSWMSTCPTCGDSK